MAIPMDTARDLVTRGANLTVEHAYPLDFLVELATIAVATGARVVIHQTCPLNTMVEIATIAGNNVTFRH